MQSIESKFFGHKDPCVWVEEEQGLYPNGAHNFELAECLGWDQEGQRTDFLVKGRHELKENQTQVIRFIRKENQNGENVTYPGVTSEQLLIVLIHRHEELDRAFPCQENKRLIEYLKKALNELEERAKTRVQRGVMGKLKQ